jgi:predicted  nucleic acid-binding Zn-ribbon protein
VDEFETKELQAMEEVDGFRIIFQQANEELGKTRAIVDADLVTIRERHARMEEQQKELRAERDKLVQSVSEDVLPLYEKLLKSKDGTAIVTLRGGNAQAAT